MQEFNGLEYYDETEEYNWFDVHCNLKSKYKENDILDIKDITYMFGTDKNIKEYEKYNRLKSSKATVVSRFQKHCIIENIDNKRYKIIKIRKKPISNKTLRTLKSKKNNKILYNLVTLFAKYLKEISDSNIDMDFLNLDLIYNLGLTNDNYKFIKSNPKIVSKYYNTDIQSIYKFIETSDSFLKRYVESAIEMLNDYGVIEGYNGRKVVKIVDGKKEIGWSFGEDNSIINRAIDKIYTKYSSMSENQDFSFQDFYFGENSKKIKKELEEELLKDNIVKFYNRYKFNYVCIDVIDDLLLELAITNKSFVVLTKKTNDNFIECVCDNSKLKNSDCQEVIQKLAKISLNNVSEYKLKEKIADKLNIGGLYRFLDKDNNVIYIGKTSNLEARIEQHFSKYGHLPKECYDNVRKIEFIKINNKTDMGIEELYYINKYQPIFNTKDKNSETASIEIKERKWIGFKTL